MQAAMESNQPLLAQARLQLEAEAEHAPDLLNAWYIARQVFDHAIKQGDWNSAVEACDVMFQAEQPDSLAALGHGLWLAVTYPIEPELSAIMLEHVVNDTPMDSDGAAIAAATACFLVDLRLARNSKAHQNLSFFTQQLLSKVARRHSQVADPDVFDFWVQKLELDNPDKFLPRLARIIDALVDGPWWFDRDALRANLPD
jgi:hypothetical protein